MAGRGVTVDFNANIARFTSSVDKMSNDLAKFQSNASRTASNINKSFSNLGSGIKGAFGGIAAALSVRELGSMADSFQNIQARLKLATRDAKEFAEASDNIKRIAASSASPLESTAALYTRISQSLLDVGGSQAQAAAVTQAMALGLRLSGATAAESSSAMLQFSQAIGSGVLRGEEFNAVNEAAPRVMKALADSLGVPVGKLREMAKEGKITRDILVNSLGSQLPKLISEAATLPNTIGAAFQAAKNELLLTVGAIDKITGASNTASKAINLVTKAFAGWRGILSPGEDQQIDKRLGSIKRDMDDILFRRKLLSSVGIDSSGMWSGQLDKLNQEALNLQKNLEKVQSVATKPAEFTPLAGPTGPSAEQIAAAKAAAEAAKKAIESLRKEGESLAASVDPIVNRNQELAKYVELLQKGAISQQTFDLAATKSINSAQAALDSVDQSLIAAKQAQEALDALTKEGENLKLAVDPFYKLNQEVERYSELLAKGVIDQRTFELAVEKSTGKSGEVVKEEVDKMSAAAIGFQTNIQSTFGQGLYNAMTGKFDNIWGAWVDLLARMASAALSAHLTESLFGANGKSGLLKGGLDILGSLLGGFGGGKSAGGTKLGSSNFGQFLWPSAKGSYFDGNVAKFAMGGIVNTPTAFQFASGGAFHQGLMGEAGPEAIMPLKRDSAGRLGVSGGGKGVSVNYAPVIQIDSRADRTEVHQIVSRAVKQGNADLVEKMQRQGLI